MGTTPGDGSTALVPTPPNPHLTELTGSDDIFTQARWLLDHPQIGQELLGRALERSDFEHAQALCREVHQLFQELCSNAHHGGRLPEHADTNVAKIRIAGLSADGREQIVFTISVPPTDD